MFSCNYYSNFYRYCMQITKKRLYLTRLTLTFHIKKNNEKEDKFLEKCIY